MRTNVRDDAAQELRHKKVRFLVGDVYVPEPAQVLIEIHGRDLLQGTVIDFSDFGTDKNAFAVVAVDGLVQPVVVPVAKIHAMEK